MKRTFLFVGLITLFLGSLTSVSAQGTSAATMKLQPSASSVKVGEVFTVKILIDTAGTKSDEAHALITYDPKLLEVQDSEVNTEGVQIKEGILYEVASTNDVDTDDGEIDYGQVSLAQTKYYTTTAGSPGELAEISFRTLAAGTAKVELQFTKGDTSEKTSSIFNATDNANVLGSVESGTFTITASGDSAAPVVTPSSVSAPVLSLTSNKASLNVVNKESATITALLVSSALVPVAGKSVTFQVGQGMTLTPLSGTTDASGKIVTQFTVNTDAKSPGTVAKIMATLTDDPTVTSTLNITLIDESLTPPSPGSGATKPVVTAAPEQLESVGPGMLLVFFLSMGLAGFAMRRRMVRD